MRSSPHYRSYFSQVSKGPVWVLIPGWAMDGTIFAHFSQPGSVLIVDTYNPFTFSQDLEIDLQSRGIRSCSLFGFSLGGCVAAQAATALENRVSDIVLVGVRPSYKVPIIKKIEAAIKTTPEAYQKQFYAACLHHKAPSSAYHVILNALLSKRPVSELLLGLEYLKTSRLDPSALSKTSLLYHGECDAIAPVQEIQRFCGDHALPLHILPGEGHLCFGSLPHYFKSWSNQDLGLDEKLLPEKRRLRF